MLTGEYQHNIDAKGRMIMPAKLREELGDTFVITKGLDGCLFVLPNSEWDKLDRELCDKPISTSRKIKLPEEPTAASASLPSKLPTTNESTTL